MFAFNWWVLKSLLVVFQNFKLKYNLIINKLKAIYTNSLVEKPLRTYNRNGAKNMEMFLRFGRGGIQWFVRFFRIALVILREPLECLVINFKKEFYHIYLDKTL